MNISDHTALRAAALASLDLLRALVERRATYVRLIEQSGLPVLETIRSSLDLLAAVASELSMVQSESAHYDFGIEPFVDQSVMEILDLCTEFVSNLQRIIGSREEFT